MRRNKRVLAPVLGSEVNWASAANAGLFHDLRRHGCSVCVRATLLLVFALGYIARTAAQEEGGTSRGRRASAPNDEWRPESDQQRAARSLFDAGTIAFRQLRYEDALESFLQAYKLTNDPVLLFSIGMSYDRLYRLPEAVKAFEDYLRAMPDAPNRPAAEERIRIIREHIDQGEAKSASAPAAQQVAAPETPAATRESAAPASVKDTDRGLRVIHPAVFWVSTAVTLGLTGAAIWAGLDFKQTSEDYDRNPTEELAREGPKTERRANALIGTAAGMAVVSAVIGVFFTDFRGRKAKTEAQQQHLKWNAWLTRDTGGMSLSRAF